MAARFELYKTGDEYRWRLRGTGQEVAAFGEGRRSKDAAIRHIEAVKKMFADARIDDTTGEADQEPPPVWRLTR